MAENKSLSVFSPLYFSLESVSLKAGEEKVEERREERERKASSASVPNLYHHAACLKLEAIEILFI